MGILLYQKKKRMDILNSSRLQVIQGLGYRYKWGYEIKLSACGAQ